MNTDPLGIKESLDNLIYMVNLEDVKQVAESSRLNLNEGELEKFTGDFEDILKMFEKIEKVDTEDVEPAFHPVEVEPDSREDVEEETLTREQAFKNTENVEGDKFKGPSA